MNDALLQAAVTVVFGALAGGLTNSVAIWMLFHPYQAPTLAGRRLGWLQGAVPKNQARLAAAIGRTVGRRLLTPEDLERIFAEPAFRSAFDERLAAFLDEVLHRERGSLTELLPPALAADVRTLLETAADRAADGLADFAASEDFPAFVSDRSDALLAAVAEVPVAGVLTPARQAMSSRAVETWLTSVADSDELARTIDDYVERASERLLDPDRTFEQVLPPGLVGSLERAIAAWLPIAIERLGTLLDDPDTRARFESVLRSLFQRLVSDLRFHQRVVARLVVTDETLERVLDTIQDEGAQRLSEMLREPAVRAAMARGVNEAIIEFLRRPVRSVLGDPESATIADARRTLTGWATGLARDPRTRAFVVERLEGALERAGARTWGEVLASVPRERVVGGLVSAARAPEGRDFVRAALRSAAVALMERPIGTPARWLPADGARRIENGIGPVLWDWLQTQVPTVVARLDVARRVETKVLHFPVPKLEEMVKQVTERELRMIVRLGYVLGAVIGLLLVGVDRLLGG